jgi:gamma-glutamyltranspeptidase/glutathione hydrolase
VPGYGFVLNDRAALFSLDPRSPNLIVPGKRPFHTLLPGFVMKDGRPVTAFGLMGGSQQAQGHVQVLVNMIDLDTNLQAASDAARFSHAQATNTLELESSLYDLLGSKLRALGHTVVSANGQSMGGYQAVSFTPSDKHSAATRNARPRDGASNGPIDGVYRGASDHRKDGQAVGW